MQKIDPTKPPEGYSAPDIERAHFEDDPDDERSRFARDLDRLIHSPAFRRLQGKTQVVTPGEADFFRTRLTHSLEVAQVARHLATRLEANRDACEASALLHDLGHPPFAHVGEQTLKKALDDVAREWGLDPVGEVGGFNGNAQSFRLAVRSLSHKPTFQGLDLTRAVLDGAIKYPWKRCTEGAPKSDKRWCFFPTERADADWVRRGVPEARVFKTSIESQIVEWADDVAYSIHDVEDWYRAGFMPLELIVQSDEARAALAERIANEVADENYDRDEAQEETKRFFNPAGGPFQGIRSGYDGSSKAKEGLRALRSALFDEFIDSVQLKDASKTATRHNNDLDIAPLAKLRSAILKELLTEFVLKHPRMATYEVGQARVIRELLEKFTGALAFDKKTMQLGEKPQLGIFPADMQQDIKRAKADPPELLRLVADHIAGMTDGYAIRLHGRLTGVGIGSFNEFV
jgi:dGTPase